MIEQDKEIRGKQLARCHCLRLIAALFPSIFCKSLHVVLYVNVADQA